MTKNEQSREYQRRYAKEICAYKKLDRKHNPSKYAKYEANRREKRKVYLKEYYEKNKDQFTRKNHEYYENNKKKIRKVDAIRHKRKAAERKATNEAISEAKYKRWVVM